MPAVQKRSSLASINKNASSDVNGSSNSISDQVPKKAKVQPNSQPSGFEEDLARLTKEISHKSGNFFSRTFY